MLNDLYHLGGKFLVSLKFIGAFTKAPMEGFIVQEVYVRGEKALLCYKHFPLGRFFPSPRRALSALQKRVEESQSLPVFRAFQLFLKICLYLQDVQMFEVFMIMCKLFGLKGFRQTGFKVLKVNG